MPTRETFVKISLKEYKFYYIGIFLISLATLSYQILITRFFSVIFLYHFSFLAISIAMFGLTRGAMQVYNNSERFSRARVDIEFARHAAWFALTSVGAMVGYLCIPLLVPEEFLAPLLAATMIIFIVPFAQSGVCVTLLLTRLENGGGRMYAADLLGAALGCLGIIIVLFLIDPVSATIWIAAFAAAAGWQLARRSDDVSTRRLTSIAAIALLVGATIHTGLYVSGNNHIGVFWAKGTEQTGTLFERWNTFSRVRVKAFGETAPFGSGFARSSEMKIDQNYLDIDADAGTVITRLNDDGEKLTYLKDDVINSAYLIRPPQDVMIVGVGGGRDILSALFFGARRITGIELNPAIIEVLEDKFADFSGHLYRQPGVSLINAEARSYINHSKDRYDLIQISLIDTWAATAAGGLALTENRLYTVEAWGDFYRALKPGGLLAVSRWYKPVGHRAEFYRLLSIAATALMHQGVPADELTRHVVALNVGHIVTVITAPDAFTPEQWQGARARLEGQGFNVMLGPDVAFDKTASVILSGKADSTFFDNLDENITASTDDKPFFFYTLRPKNVEKIFSSRGNGEEGQRSSESFKNNSAIGTVVILLIMSFLACFFYIGVPFIRLAKQMPLSAIGGSVVYFCAIGLGFMLIEISQMQRLAVFLGSPVYGLGVVLFSLLLFSGIGSMTVGRDIPSRRAVIARIGCLMVTLLAVGLLTPMVTHWAKADTTTVRILISVLLLAPPAFFMGMMFPLGLSVWRKHSELLPFFWSANGITSVFASVLGMALSMELGIAVTFMIGACCYVLCSVMIAHRVANGANAPV